MKCKHSTRVRFIDRNVFFCEECHETVNPSPIDIDSFYNIVHHPQASCSCHPRYRISNSKKSMCISCGKDHEGMPLEEPPQNTKKELESQNLDVETEFELRIKKSGDDLLKATELTPEEFFRFGGDMVETFEPVEIKRAFPRGFKEVVLDKSSKSLVSHRVEYSLVERDNKVFAEPLGKPRIKVSGYPVMIIDTWFPLEDRACVMCGVYGLVSGIQGGFVCANCGHSQEVTATCQFA
jgi:hypothetical protein